VSRIERDAGVASRPPLAPWPAGEDRRQASEHEGRTGVREQESTPSVVAEIADGGPRRAVPRPDLDAVLGALDHAIAVVDAEWRIVAVNSAWERILGRPSGECLRRDVFGCFPVFSAPAAAEMIRATGADGITRRFDVQTPSLAHGTETYGVRVPPAAGGMLVLELSRPFDGHSPRLGGRRASRGERLTSWTRAADGGSR
jgi:PAS domain-containing protein